MRSHNTSAPNRGHSSHKTNGSSSNGSNFQRRAMGPSNNGMSGRVKGASEAKNIEEMQEEIAKSGSYFTDYNAGRKSSSNRQEPNSYANQYKKYNGSGPPMPTSQMVKHMIDNPPKASGMQKYKSQDDDPDKFDSTDALRTQLKFARREIDQLKN